jgi:hypothetical protein
MRTSLLPRSWDVPSRPSLKACNMHKNKGGRLSYRLVSSRLEQATLARCSKQQRLTHVGNCEFGKVLNDLRL